MQCQNSILKFSQYAHLPYVLDPTLSCLLKDTEPAILSFCHVINCSFSTGSFSYKYAVVSPS